MHDGGEGRGGVVRVHRAHLLQRGRAEDVHDGGYLVEVARPAEERASEQQLRKDAPRRPHVDGGGVVRCREQQLWRAVIQRANVRGVLLAGTQHLGAAKVAQLQSAALCVHEHVLRLQVTVADPELVDVLEGAEHLVRVERSAERRETQAIAGVPLDDGVQRLREVLEHEVQVDARESARVKAVEKPHDVLVAQAEKDAALAVRVPSVVRRALHGDELLRVVP